MIYIKFSTNLCNLIISVRWQSTEKNNLNIAQFVEYINYLAIPKHIDLILGNFSEDSIREGPFKISLQSLGFYKLASEAELNRSAFLDHIFIRNTRSKFSCFKVKMESDHEQCFLYYEP